LLSDDQKKWRIVASRELLSLLQACAEHNFETIASEDESSFQYASCFDLMFAESRESVVPRIRQGISGQKTMIPIFFTSPRLLVLEALPKGLKFNRDHFIQAALPGLSDGKRRISREKKLRGLFSSHGQFNLSHWSQSL
jgi:hypothetical protein